MQGNLSTTYDALGRPEALQMKRDTYTGYLKLKGEGNIETCRAASNYTISLLRLERFEEAKSLMRQTIPVARRVLGEGHDLTFTLRSVYANALYNIITRRRSTRTQPPRSTTSARP